MYWRLFLIFLLGLSIAACRAGQKDARVEVGQADDFPVGSVTFFELDTSFEDPDPPAIASGTPGVVTQPAAMHISPVPIYLVHDPSAGFLALYNRDPHLGCRVNWVEDRQRFENPCHGEQYTRTGEYFSGPSPRGLDRFEVEVTADGDVVVDVSKYQEGSPSP